MQPGDEYRMELDPGHLIEVQQTAPEFVFVPDGDHEHVTLRVDFSPFLARIRELEAELEKLKEEHTELVATVGIYQVEIEGAIAELEKVPGSALASHLRRVLEAGRE